MSTPPATRWPAIPRSRRLASAIAALLALTIAGAPAGAQAAVSSKQATTKALAALGVNSRSTPEVVFRAPDPVATGTKIRLSAPMKVSDTSSDVDGTGIADAKLVMEAGARSWLFYNDRAPGRGSQRPGRIALVSTSTGRVTLSAELQWPPLVGGTLPVFLRSTRGYDDADHRVFERGTRTARRLADNSLLLSPDQLDGKTVVSALNAKSCFIQMGDALTDSVFGAEGYGLSTALVEAFSVRTAAFRKGWGTARYGPTSQSSPRRWLEAKLKNCAEAFVWIGSAGYAGDRLLLGSAPTTSGTKVKVRQISGSDLALAARERKGTRITLMIDAPNRDQIVPKLLQSASNVRVLPVPAGVTPGSRTRGEKHLAYTRRLIAGWIRVSKVSPTDRYESGPSCQSGMPFFFSRAVDPTACTAPPPPPPPPIAPPPPLVLIVPPTNILVGLSTTTPTPEFGGLVTLNVSLTNAGPFDTTETQIKVPLPPGLTLLSPVPAGYDPATGVWNVGPVPAGAVRLLPLQATISTVAPVTVTAESSAVAPPDVDSTPNNGNPSEDDQASVTITPRAADLELTASPGAGAWTTGTSRQIAITLSNKGPDPAITNTVQIQLPPGIDFDANTLTGGSYNSTSGLWSVPTLGVNESVTLRLFVNVLSAGTKVIPISLIGAERGDPDSAPANGPGEDDDATLTIPVA